MLSKILFLALVAGAFAQSKFTCKMPQQWQARMIAFDPNHRQYHNHTSQYRVYGKYTYDGLEQRKHIYEDAAFGDESDQYFEVLELYREKKVRNPLSIDRQSPVATHDRQAYVTDIKTRECFVYPIEWEFRPHDIPSNARFIGYEYLGAYPDQFELSQWHSYSPYRGMNVSRYMTYSESNCAPVRDDHFTEQTGFHYEEFSDLTLGINDPNIWIPPSNCKAPPQA